MFWNESCSCLTWSTSWVPGLVTRTTRCSQTFWKGAWEAKLPQLRFNSLFFFNDKDSSSQLWKDQHVHFNTEYVSCCESTIGDFFFKVKWILFKSLSNWHWQKEVAVQHLGSPPSRGEGRPAGGWRSATVCSTNKLHLKYFYIYIYIYKKKRISHLPTSVTPQSLKERGVKGRFVGR